jgi:hypothetical protein
MTRTARPVARAHDAAPPIPRAQHAARAWVSMRTLVLGRHAVAAAAARPATRPENRQPPRKVPSSDR